MALLYGALIGVGVVVVYLLLRTIIIKGYQAIKPKTKANTNKSTHQQQ